MNDTYPLGHLNISGLETGRCRYVPLWLSCKQYSPWGLLMHFAAAAAAAAVPFILQWWWARLMGTLLGPIGLQDGWASLDGLLAVAGTSHWGIVGAVLVVLSGVAPCSLLCCSLCSQWWQDDWTAARGQWCPKMTEYGQGVLASLGTMHDPSGFTLLRLPLDVIIPIWPSGRSSVLPNFKL